MAEIDIVFKLQQSMNMGFMLSSEDLAEAAEEIARLRGENEGLQAALKLKVADFIRVGVNLLTSAGAFVQKDEVRG